VGTKLRLTLDLGFARREKWRGVFGLITEIQKPLKVLRRELATTTDY
jgi:hypothetical protein